MTTAKDHEKNNIKGEGIAGKLAASFLNSKLTPLFVITSLLLGLLAVGLTPRGPPTLRTTRLPAGDFLLLVPLQSVADQVPPTCVAP